MNKSFAKNIAWCFLLAALGVYSTGAAQAQAQKRPNILLLTGDDLNWDSLGAFGCPIPGISPNLDKLAAESMKFTQAHVAATVCGPSRTAMLTGRYPHTSGGDQFHAIRADVETLPATLKKHGYLNGILGKENHTLPIAKFDWDLFVRGETQPWPRDLDDESGKIYGRLPGKFIEYSKGFFQRAKAENKPFFLNVNSYDPHRPFVGDDTEWQKFGRHSPVNRIFWPDEIIVPGFLPDLPSIRVELAQYFTSVHRLDETMGGVLRELDAAGLADNTIVIFLSDHGMAFPFGKATLYPHATRTPLLVRWAGRVKPKTVNHDFVSLVDLMPTILEAAGLPPEKSVDGRSFLPLLEGKAQGGRDYVFTEYADPVTRSAQSQKFCYIVNLWADGKRRFGGDWGGGRTLQTMEKAAETDPQIAARVQLLRFRVPEEFYDLENDPWCLNNLISEKKYQNDIQTLRGALLDWMKRTNDPALEATQQRTPAAFAKFRQQHAARLKESEARTQQAAKSDAPWIKASQLKPRAE